MSIDSTTICKAMADALFHIQKWLDVNIKSRYQKIGRQQNSASIKYEQRDLPGPQLYTSYHLSMYDEIIRFFIFLGVSTQYLLSIYYLVHCRKRFLTMDGLLCSNSQIYRNFYNSSNNSVFKIHNFTNGSPCTIKQYFIPKYTYYVVYVDKH